MLLIFQVIVFFAGLFSLITGRTPLRRENPASPGRARLAGAVLMLPVPVTFTIGFCLGMMGVTTDSILLLAAIEWAVFGGAVGLAMALARPASVEVVEPVYGPTGTA